MILDLECVKDIMLIAEERTSYSHIIEFHRSVDKVPEYMRPLFEKYDSEKIMYHVRYCVDCQFLYNQEYGAHLPYNMPSIRIVDLTPTGHEFANGVRNDDVYKKLVNLLDKTGLNSANAWMETISTAVSLIRENLN